MQNDLTRKSVRITVASIAASMCVVILPSHTNAASAVIDLTPVGYVGTTMKSNYYVVFAARPLSSTGSSFGHAFLGVGIEDYDMNRSSYIAYGEWPSGSASGALLRLSKLPARVLQETLSKTDRDSSGHSPFDYTETLIVKVTEEAHDALQKEIQRYNRVETAPPLTYALISNDCATFAAMIATELGLHPPERNALTPGTWLPEAFIVKFREQVTQPLTMQYPGGLKWTGPVLNGLPHGEGRLDDFTATGRPKFSFHGYMKFGQFDQGKIDFEGDRSFEGTWSSNGDWHDGRYNSPNVTFEGRFWNGKPTDGRWNYKDGSAYTGSVNREGLPDGQGSYRWKDGSSASGRFSKGRLMDGRYKTADGWILDGSFGSGGGFLYGTYTRPDGQKGTFGEVVRSSHGVPPSSTGSRPYPGPPPVQTQTDDRPTMKLRLIPGG